MAEIRTAVATDAAPLAHLAEQTFRDTFSHYNTAADTELHCRARFGEALQAAEIGNPHMVTLVCEQEGQLIAFAQLRWGEVPAGVPGAAPGEILRFYVARGWHGQGVAQRLMTACFDALTQHEADAAWLGVWEHNPLALAFYRKFGFEPVGEHTFIVGHDPQRDLIVARRLD